MRLWKVLFYGLGGTLVVAVGGGAALVAGFDPNDHRPRLEALASSALGRPVTLGTLRLQKSLTPVLVVENLLIGNAPGGSRPDFARVDRLELQIQLLPLLSKEVRIDRLAIAGGDILLEQIDGKLNLPLPAAKAPGTDNSTSAGEKADSKKPLLHIQDLTLINTKLTQRQGGQSHVVLVNRLDSRVDGLDQPLPLKLDGQIDGVAVTVTGSVGLPGPVPAALPVVLAGEALGVRFKLDGQYGPAPEAAVGTVEVQLADPKTLSALVPAAADLPQPLGVQARLDVAGPRVQFADLVLKAGTVEISGQGRVDLAARPKLTATLTSPLLDLDALGGGAKPAATPEGTSAPATNPAPRPAARSNDGKLIPDTPLPFPTLPIDADLTLTVPQVRGAGHVLSNVEAHVLAEGEKLSLAPLRFTYAGSRFDLALAEQTAAKTLSVKLDGKGVDLAALATALGQKPVLATTADLAVDLSGTGASLRPWLASSQGSVSLAARGGGLRNEYIDLLAVDLLRFLLPGASKGGETALSCVVLRGPVQGGVMSVRNGLVETKQIAVTAGGTINLGQELLGLKISPRPRAAALLSLAVRFSVSGSFAHPSVAPDTESLATNAAGAALGVATGGAALGVIGGLSAQGAGDLCGAALAGQTPPEAAPSATPTTPPAAGAPTGATNNNNNRRNRSALPSLPVPGVVQDLLRR